MGPTRLVWHEQTLVEQLAITAARHGARRAFLDGDTAVTWSEVRSRSRELAKGLIEAGVQPGDRIALWLPNRIEFFELWLAAAHVGAAVVPINTRYRAGEFEYVLSQSEARLLFVVDRFLSTDYQAMLGAVRPLQREADFPYLKGVYSISADATEGSVNQLLERAAAVSDAELDEVALAVQPTDTTVIIYTSGSTGRPKGAMHSHNVLRNEYAITEWLDIQVESRILGHMPFFHVAGGLSALLPALITGASIVLMDHWDPEAALRLIEKQRITVFGGIATHFLDLLSTPDLESHDLSSLHSGWVGGSMNPRELMQAIRHRLGYRVFPAYGMTETTSVTAYPHWDDPESVFEAGKGVPISDFELKLIDVVDGHELGPDESGEVCVRGHLVMQGYYKMPEATAAVMDAEGWFHTGDVGRFDADGYLSIVGRQKDMYIVGGSNVYPAEVETVLVSLDGIRHAQVVAVPDERLGEVGYAFVELEPQSRLTVDGVIELCRPLLASYKCPRHGSLVTEWPRLDNGKIDRKRLQALAIEGLGLAELAERRLLLDDGSAGRSGISVRES